jgi:hypothetical protein
MNIGEIAHPAGVHEARAVRASRHEPYPRRRGDGSPARHILLWAPISLKGNRPARTTSAFYLGTAVPAHPQHPKENVVNDPF